MNIIYNNDTLFVNFNSFMDDLEIENMKKRVFTILSEYDIENIVLNIISKNKNNILLDDFIKEYHQKYKGNLFVK